MRGVLRAISTLVDFSLKCAFRCASVPCLVTEPRRAASCEPYASYWRRPTPHIVVRVRDCIDVRFVLHRHGGRYLNSWIWADLGLEYSPVSSTIAFDSSCEPLVQAFQISNSHSRTVFPFSMMHFTKVTLLVFLAGFCEFTTACKPGEDNACAHPAGFYENLCDPQFQLTKLIQNSFDPLIEFSSCIGHRSLYTIRADALLLSWGQAAEGPGVRLGLCEIGWLPPGIIIVRYPSFYRHVLLARVSLIGNLAPIEYSSFSGSVNSSPQKIC
ncbi:hypothetical protein MJO28_012875, partial [Puccinia striiformis f. sp. tritici]